MERVEMNAKQTLIILAVVLGAADLVCASQPDLENARDANTLWQQETLTDGFWGLSDQLADKGLELTLSVTQVYQQKVHGGIGADSRSERFPGSFDFELLADLQKILTWDGAIVYALAESSWPGAEGIDDQAVGSYFGVNDDAAGCRHIDVTECWYGQALFEDNFQYRLGKLDLTSIFFATPGITGAFDASNFANDETTQFLNSSLVNNPTIPFPDNGLGAEVLFRLADFGYVCAALADARADIHQTGFNTAFHGECDYIYIAETGINTRLRSTKGPLQGSYRFGVWYDPQQKEEFSTGEIIRDDAGFYLSCDQMVLRENSDPDDAQGLGLFGRYGWADSRVNLVTNFWSAGVQYQGLLSGRDEDVLGFGFAQGFFSNQASDFTDDYESIWELYYRAQIAPWMAATPDIQYVANPGGDDTVIDAWVLGVRLYVIF
jgi:carbohydrate-selective porin OprB